MFIFLGIHADLSCDGVKVNMDVLFLFIIKFISIYGKS